MSQVVAQRWRFSRRLKVGGQAEVWLVFDELERRWTVGKRYSANRNASVGDLRIRHEREVEHARKVRAAGGRVLKVLDAEVEEGTDNAYIISELAHHGSVADRVHDANKLGAAFPRRLAIEVLTVLGDTLAVASALRILHRDIKPANIMLDDHDRPYLGDWGIAQASADETITEGVIGSIAYMAPERRMRGAKADSRSEVYSVAVVAYELLTGVLLRPGEEPMRPSARNGTLPSAVDSILLRGLEEKPQKRWATAHEMTNALVNVLSAWAEADPAPLVARKLAAEAEILTDEELDAIGDAVAQTRPMPPRRSAAGTGPSVTAQLKAATQLYRAIAAVIAAITIALLAIYLWPPLSDVAQALEAAVTTVRATVADCIALVGRDGEQGIGLVALAAAFCVLLVRGLLRRRGLPGGVLLVGCLTIAALSSLAVPPDATRDRFGVLKTKAHLIRAMRAEGRRWSGHYARFPNKTDREYTAKAIRQAVHATRQARADSTGFDQLREADRQLKRWRSDRRKQAAAGNW
jgi:tRNA A-37 threonylcarbamoyl transferase component Bud32